MMLKKEVAFWSERRRDKATGLFSYGGEPDEAAIMMLYDCALKRRNIEPCDDAKLIWKIGLETLAQAESGWDFTARFEDNCRQCAAIDLNCLLYLSLEQLARLAEYSGESRDFWLERAAELKAALYQYCRREDGIFVDYFFDSGKTGRIISTASFYPLWVGLCSFGRSGKSARYALQKTGISFWRVSYREFFCRTFFAVGISEQLAVSGIYSHGIACKIRIYKRFQAHCRKICEYRQNKF